MQKKYNRVVQKKVVPMEEARRHSNELRQFTLECRMQNAHERQRMEELFWWATVGRVACDKANTKCPEIIDEEEYEARRRGILNSIAALEKRRTEEEAAAEAVAWRMLVAPDSL